MLAKRTNSFEGIPNSQTALESLVSQLSGGSKYRVGNSTDANYGLVGLTVTDTADLVTYPTLATGANSFALVTFNNIADPDDATQILFPVLNLAALPIVYGTTYSLANIGSWPLNQPVPKDYNITANFETGALIADEHSVTTTMVQAGNNALQGTLMSATVPSPIPRANLTKAGILSNVDGSEHVSITSVVSDHTCIGAGDSKVYSFAGNFVDDPDDYVLQRSGLFGVNNPNELVAASATETGGIPDYVGSPVDIVVNFSITMPAVAAGVTVYHQGTISADWGNCGPTGNLVLTTTSQNGLQYITGPTVAGAIFTNNVVFRSVNPTKLLGFLSYLMGIRLGTLVANANTGVPIVGALVQHTLTVRFPNQGPAFRAGQKITILQNYLGPYTIVHSQQWMARPNRQRQADYKGQVIRPMPMHLKDAIVTAVYAAFGPSMGRCFGNRDEFVKYVEMVSDPEFLMNITMRDEYSGMVQDLGDGDAVRAQHDARAPLLEAARYRAAAGHKGRFNASLWGAIAQFAKGAWDLAKPAIRPVAQTVFDGIFGTAEQVPKLASARYEGARFGSTRSALTDGATEETGSPDESAKPRVLLTVDDSGPLSVRPKIHYYLEMGKESKVESKDKETDDCSDDDSVEVQLPNGTKIMYHKKTFIKFHRQSGLPQIRDHLNQSRFRASGKELPEDSYVPCNSRVMSQPVHSVARKLQMAEALHAAGYRYDNPAQAKAVLSSNSLPTKGGFRASGKNRFEQVEEFSDDAESAGGNMDFGDVDEDLPLAPVIVKTKPQQPVVERKNAPPPVADPGDAGFEPVSPNLLESTDVPEDYSKEEMKSLMVPYTRGYIYDVASTGAGPIISAYAQKRIAGVMSRPINKMYRNSCAHAVLVGKGGENAEVYVATVCVTNLPLNRSFAKLPEDEKGNDALSTHLQSTYTRVGNFAVKDGTKTVGAAQFFLGNEFKSSTIGDVKRVLDLYAKMSVLPLMNRYISCVIQGFDYTPQDIDGDSFTLALMSALLGLPAGPVMTGSVSATGLVNRVGDINQKIGAFYNKNSKYGPLIMPKNNFPDRVWSSNEGLNFALIGACVQDYQETKERGLLPIHTVGEMISFFTSGGYAMWAKEIDPKGALNSYSEKMYAASNNAMSIRFTMQNMARLREKFQLLQSGDASEEEVKKVQEEFEKLKLEKARQAELMTVFNPPMSEKEKVKQQTMANSSEQSEWAAKVALAHQKVGDKSKLFQYKTRKGTYTRTLGKIESWPDTESIPAVLRGQPTGNKATQVWEAKNLMGKGKFFNLKGKDGATVYAFYFVPDVFEVKGVASNDDPFAEQDISAPVRDYAEARAVQLNKAGPRGKTGVSARWEL